MSSEKPTTDYTAMSAPKLIEACGDNAKLWAEAFMQIAHHAAMTSGQSVIDEAYMIGWFANAIEAASMKRMAAFHRLIDKLEHKLMELGSNSDVSMYD